MFSGGIDKQHRAVWVKLDIWIAIKISGNFNAASLITTAEIIFCWLILIISQRENMFNKFYMYTNRNHLSIKSALDSPYKVFPLSIH